MLATAAEQWQVEILQSEYEEMNATATTKPFYDHVSFAQDRIRELERMNQLQVSPILVRHCELFDARTGASPCREVGLGAQTSPAPGQLPGHPGRD